MCGICGFTGQQSDDSKEILTNMMNKIIHRGPDSEGQYFADGIALGFRRLSIIDLDYGHQPMKNANEDIVEAKVSENTTIYYLTKSEDNLSGIKMTVIPRWWML